VRNNFRERNQSAADFTGNMTGFALLKISAEKTP